MFIFQSARMSTGAKKRFAGIPGVSSRTNRLPRHQPDRKDMRSYCDRDRKTGCWNWALRLNFYGYGVITIYGKGKEIGAHRVTWSLWNGRIPKGIKVCHKCDNPRCCNPKHLFLGTQKDNLQDAARKGRMLHGINNHMAKLALRDVKIIRSSKQATRGLVKRFGVSRTAINNVRCGKSFRFN